MQHKLRGFGRVRYHLYQLEACAIRGRFQRLTLGRRLRHSDYGYLRETAMQRFGVTTIQQWASTKYPSHVWPFIEHEGRAVRLYRVRGKNRLGALVARPFRRVPVLPTTPVILSLREDLTGQDWTAFRTRARLVARRRPAVRSNYNGQYNEMVGHLEHAG